VAKKITIIIVLLGVVSFAFNRAVFGQGSPTPDAAQRRAASYYDALRAADYPVVWSFFGTRMRADNPRTEYVEHVRQTFKRIETSRPPVLREIVTTGAEKRPVARIQTEVILQLSSGQSIRATHDTEWIWQRSPDAPGENWFLARDTMKEGTASTE
jgi:hypothetical protein